MARNSPGDAAEPEGIDSPSGRMWNMLREHDTHLSTLAGKVEGVEKTLSGHGAKIDQVLQAVTTYQARQGPGLLQMLGTFAMLLGIAGGLSGGVAIFVGSMYDSRIAAIEKDAKASAEDLAVRNAEDRAELVRLRYNDRLATARRLDDIEESRGWGNLRVTPAPGLP